MTRLSSISLLQFSDLHIETCLVLMIGYVCLDLV